MNRKQDQLEINKRNVMGFYDRIAHANGMF